MYLEPNPGIFGNIKISGNAIISTDPDGDITIDPNGNGDIKMDGNTLVVDTSSGRVNIGAYTGNSLFFISQDADASDSADLTNYHASLFTSSGANGEEIGMSFTIYSSGSALDTATPGAAITHERTNSWSQGKLHFKTKQNTTQSGTLTTAMTIDESGILNFGTHSAIGAETVTGYITIKDIGGTSRKIAVVS